MGTSRSKPRIETSCINNSRGELVKHLIINDVIWMSNDDEEYQDIDKSLATAHGDCYIGGLGMGLIAKLCAEKNNVDSVYVVEINRDIIDLVSPELKNPKIKIFQGDARYDFLSRHYDWMYFDIWL